MNELLQSRWFPLALLTASNLFMTAAWYGHLRYKSAPLWIVVLASWGIAFFEYMLQVPANRWGSTHYSVTQLKILQEVITLCVFSGFAMVYLGEESAGTISRPSSASWPSWLSPSCRKAGGPACNPRFQI